MVELRDPAGWEDRREPSGTGCLPYLVALIIVAAIFLWTAWSIV